MKAGSPPVASSQSPPPSARQAFTLVEMLAVLGIIVILVALIIPPATNLLKGSELTQGGQDLSDQLGLARQTALTQNHPVEVRLYQYGDPNRPDESVSSPSTGKYRALQTFTILETGVAVPLTKIEHFPGTFMIDSGTADVNTSLSSIIGNAHPSTGSSASTAGPILTTSGSQTPSLPALGAQTKYNMVSFRFYPDGSTNISDPTITNWFLTAHTVQDGDHPTNVPKNFLTIQIDPSNGNLHEFRP